LEHSDRLHEPPHGRAQDPQPADEPHASRLADREQRDDATDDDGRMQQRRSRDSRDAVDALEPRLDAGDLLREDRVAPRSFCNCASRSASS
jgi:hypothetical protein